MTPLGELVAEPGRGLVYGNRGCLHDAHGTIRRRFAGRRWIACRLAFRGWHRSPLLQPGRFTELFFLDEATAFAAGHRPCALCRREDYNVFVARWGELHPRQHGADAIDEQLHAERIDPANREHRLHRLPYAELPDGAFVVHDGRAEARARPETACVVDRRLRRDLAPPSVRGGGRDHAAVPARRAERGLGRRGAAPAPLSERVRSGADAVSS